MTVLDLALIVVFGGYSLLGWAMVPGTWRGEVPEAEQVRAATGVRRVWLHYRYRFGWYRTGVVHLLVVNGFLLTYLAVRLHDLVGTRAVYVAAGVIGLVSVVFLVLWASVGVFGRPKFVVPPHLRDYEEE